MVEKRKASLVKEKTLLILLTIIIVLLIFLFNEVTYTPAEKEAAGLPSFGLWKPIEDIRTAVNVSGNDTLIEKNNMQGETPSNLDLLKATFKQYWISYAVLLLIIILLIAWVSIVFKIYNG